MIRHLILIVFVTLFSTFPATSAFSTPSENPKVSTTLPPPPNTSGEYGEVNFNGKDAKPVLQSPIEGDVIIRTTVAEVCPNKGCWMNVQGGKPGEQLRVTFKDYGFFVPTELAGKEVALQGRYEKHVESIKEQKHLLKDAKRPQAEIDAVTKPKEIFRFVATGVKVLPAESK